MAISALPSNRRPLYVLLKAFLEDEGAAHAAVIGGATLKWDYVGNKFSKRWNAEVASTAVRLIEGADFVLLLEEQDEGWDELITVKVIKPEMEDAIRHAVEDFVALFTYVDEAKREGATLPQEFKEMSEEGGET
ncbi:MAG: hypothetical protein DRJ67_05225 [Thermoprotei archaeon]|nr:MAG: hypothetical protein DRJ67_05225 [Thermoprotei archaeon]